MYMYLQISESMLRVRDKSSTFFAKKSPRMFLHLNVKAGINIKMKLFLT